MKRGEKARMLFELLCDMLYGESGMPGVTSNKAFFEAFKEVVDAEAEATKELKSAAEKIQSDFERRTANRIVNPIADHEMNEDPIAKESYSDYYGESQFDQLIEDTQDDSVSVSN